MFYHLLYPLRDLWFGFNVFRYITFRAAMASITAFIICIVFGPVIINILKRLKIGQNIKKDHVEDLYELHKHKSGTPTMGGFIILLSVVLSTVLWARMDNRFVIMCLISLLWLGLVGFMDDYIKMIKRRSQGLQASTKLIGQLILAIFLAIYIYKDPAISPTLHFPFFKNLIWNMGIFYILFVVLVIVGSSNAVNLTDGLDGLAIGCITIVALTYAIITYIVGNAVMSGYLNIFYLPESSELSILCAAIVGSGLGFLWFNSHPAEVFMGDTGALALGGVIGLISVVIKKEAVLFCVGGIFVIEVISVIIQVLALKTRGKRFFLMTPLHHHFQLKGMHESKVIIRFWIVSIILALVALSTLKLR